MVDNHPRRLVVGPAGQGRRLDAFLAGQFDFFSRSQIQRFIKDGLVSVNGSSRPSSHVLRTGDHVEFSAPPSAQAEFTLIPQDIPIRIVHLDDDIVVVDKPPDLVVHPAHGHWDGTLLNALLGRGVGLSRLGSPYRPGVVHRLDKNTSGLIVVARNDPAYEHLAAQIKARTFEKVYHAIAWGNISPKQFTVDAPIGRHPVDRTKMMVVKTGGREAVSNFFVVDNFKQFNYIRITTSTGRTHQIRVHLAHIHHPVLGDPVYGGRRRKGADSSADSRRVRERILKIMERHALHASSLAFTHPRRGRRLEFRSALPDDMLETLEVLYTADRFKEAEV
jgi:23S rRNA pseudouridine1911/1915/1917 synthase